MKRRLMATASLIGVLVTACGSVPQSQFGDTAPFGSNDDQCESATLRNEDDDQIVLDEALNCFLAEYDAGKPVTIDIDQPTVEGDPIFRRYRFDGETVLIVDDSRADEFGQGIIRARTCSGLSRDSRMPEGTDCDRVSHPGFPEAD